MRAVRGWGGKEGGRVTDNLAPRTVKSILNDIDTYISMFIWESSFNQPETEFQRETRRIRGRVRANLKRLEARQEAARRRGRT